MGHSQASARRALFALLGTDANLRTTVLNSSILLKLVDIDTVSECMHVHYLHGYWICLCTCEVEFRLPWQNNNRIMFLLHNNKLVSACFIVCVAFNSVISRVADIINVVCAMCRTEMNILNRHNN